MSADWSDREILARRGARNVVDPEIPYAFFVEPEAAADGGLEDVATIFLTNRECPFRCLYCDLWKNTTETTVPVGAIPRQIAHALQRLPPARNLKLYNSGNFFDAKAIPPEDHREIARQAARFDTVIVENHPRLIGPSSVVFRDLLRESRRERPHMEAGPSHLGEPQLEVAMGLETVHPGILPRLNKGMTLQDFRRAADFLRGNAIELRAFVLLQPPFMPSAEAVDWALRSVEVAFDSGVRVVAVIPTRGGNGALDDLARVGEFQPPALRQLERVLEVALAWNRGRVFVDLWDAERFSRCAACGPARLTRLAEMNRRQLVLPALPDCVQPECPNRGG